jgi:LmbE family N-acetylglucosaminyl deacetylase
MATGGHCQKYGRSMNFGRNILILAPHPDDEVVACHAAIAHASTTGAKIFIYFLTNGVVARELLWPWQQSKHPQRIKVRRHEAEQTVAQLGCTNAGFADRPTRSLRYYMLDLQYEIAALIERHQIDQLWTLAYEGGHPDHDCANAVASRWRDKISVLEFSAYNNAGKAGQNFPQLQGNENIITLNTQERAAKQAALALYHSEQKNLGYVGLTQEIYRPLANHDYAQPPHAGTMWYARFHWVPFRHPRIDRTTSRDVCVAIAQFFATQD